MLVDYYNFLLDKDFVRSHLLIIDDDRKLCELLKQLLIKNGFIVSAINDPRDLDKYLEVLLPDLIIMDLMMPHISGLELTKILRGKSIEIPILILTALGDTAEKIEGLKVGADDYLAKPFEPEELILRTNAILKRTKKNNNTNNNICLGNSQINLNNGIILQDGHECSLTSAELKLLKILYSCKDQIVERSSLSELCGGINPRSVDVNIIRLRQKLEQNPDKPKYLITARGSGYMLTGVTVK